MSKSQTACTIEATESTVVRLKSTGGGGYCLSGCKTLPFGLGDLASGKGRRMLNKIGRFLSEWPQEELALSVGPERYLPLPAYFPPGANREEQEECCRIEAGYFLTSPDSYRCDMADYGSGNCAGMQSQRLLLFYLAAPFKTALEHFSASHTVSFSGTPQLPLFHLSRLTEEPQVILELEQSYVLLTRSRGGHLEEFACHQVKSREEREYFTIKELMGNPVYRESSVQVTGSKADKAMTAIISRETSLKLMPLSLPRSIAISNPQKFPIASSSAVKAISTALMAIARQREAVAQ